METTLPLGFRCTLARLSLFCFLLFPFAATLARAADLTQDDIDFRKKVYTNKAGDRLPYRLFVPLGYDASRRYPLMLWLHGGEGRGSDNIKQLTGNNSIGSHFWASHDVQLKFPMFVLLPQCPSNENWSDPEINQPTKWLSLTMDALRAIQKEFSIDADRIYIGGQTMGGLGAWSAIQAYPAQFAAAVIVATYDNFTDIPTLARTPLWVFQGEADQNVPVTLVRDMMKQLRKAHANLRYTEYPKAGHDIWPKVFAEPDLLPWLSSQQRGAQPQPPSQVGSSATQK